MSLRISFVLVNYVGYYSINIINHFMLFYFIYMECYSVSISQYLSRKSKREFDIDKPKPKKTSIFFIDFFYFYFEYFFFISVLYILFLNNFQLIFKDIWSKSGKLEVFCWLFDVDVDYCCFRLRGLGLVCFIHEHNFHFLFNTPAIV